MNQSPAPAETEALSRAASAPGLDAPVLQPDAPGDGPPPPPLRDGRRLARLRRVARYDLAVSLRHWRALRPAQKLTIGFFSYVVFGVAALSLPIAQAQPTAMIDNLFNVVSAISTTGLTTVSVSDSYTFLGEAVLLVLFQLGGIGYMTVSSFLLLARGQRLNDARLGVLRAGFALPEDFQIHRFVSRVVVFTLAIEAAGALLLYGEFRAYGVENAAWSAVFHSVSAFATAGFSLNNSSLEPFRDSMIVNGTIAVLCYLGALGFIVLQDAWQSARSRERRLTFTSKVILAMTAAIFLGGAPILWAVEPTIRQLPLGQGVMAAAFQVMTASSTAGFNTVPIGALGSASLTLIIVAMIVGASPSGTGGGIKTTTASAMYAVVMSILRGRERVTLLGHEIPLPRVLSAFAAATFYLAMLTAGVFLLCLTESRTFLDLVFEATSALGTVGLSMGATGELTPWGKLVVTALMFAGRVGPLTIGLALLQTQESPRVFQRADLAV